MVYRETINWNDIREKRVLARITGAEQADTIVLSSYTGVAPTESLLVDPARALSQTQKIYRAGQILAKITKNVGGGQNEAGKWGPFDPESSVDGRDAQLVGVLKTGVVANNNAVRFSARVPGPLGHQITVTLTDPGAASQALSVSVANEFDIDVSLATDAGSAISSTAADVIAAVNADAVAGQLVQAANESTSDGTGVVVAEAKANLAGAQADVDIAVLIEDTNVQFGDAVVGAFVGGCVFRQDMLLGYTDNEANLDAAFASQASEVVTMTDVTP